MKLYIFDFETVQADYSHISALINTPEKAQNTRIAVSSNIPIKRTLDMLSSILYDNPSQKAYWTKPYKFNELAIAAISSKGITQNTSSPITNPYAIALSAFMRLQGDDVVFNIPIPKYHKKETSPVDDLIFEFDFIGKNQAEKKPTTYHDDTITYENDSIFTLKIGNTVIELHTETFYKQLNKHKDENYKLFTVLFALDNAKLRLNNLNDLDEIGIISIQSPTHYSHISKSDIFFVEDSNKTDSYFTSSKLFSQTEENAKNESKASDSWYQKLPVFSYLFRPSPNQAIDKTRSENAPIQTVPINFNS